MKEFHSIESSVSDSFDSDSNSDIAALDNVDPEQQIMDHIEKYYNDNYNAFDVSIEKDYVHNRVWQMHFDEMHDMVYIVMAKIKVTKGET